MSSDVDTFTSARTRGYTRKTNGLSKSRIDAIKHSDKDLFQMPVLISQTEEDEMSVCNERDESRGVTKTQYIHS